MDAILVDDIFKCIFMNEKFFISILISSRFISKGPTDNKSALVQVMAWCQTGDKPLSEPMPTQFTVAKMLFYGSAFVINMIQYYPKPLLRNTE